MVNLFYIINYKRYFEIEIDKVKQYEINVSFHSFECFDQRDKIKGNGLFKY